jgi:hypothetical protein
MSGEFGRTESDDLIGCISLDSYLKYISQVYNTQCEIHEEEVPIMGLLITQDSIDRQKYDLLISGKAQAKDPIIIVQGLEAKFLVVGHTRARAEHDKGQSYIKAHVLSPNTLRLEEALQEQNLNLMNNCNTRKINSINFYERPKQ